MNVATRVSGRAPRRLRRVVSILLAIVVAPAALLIAAPTPAPAHTTNPPFSECFEQFACMWQHSHYGGGIIQIQTGTKLNNFSSFTFHPGSTNVNDEVSSVYNRAFSRTIFLYQHSNQGGPSFAILAGQWYSHMPSGFWPCWNDCASSNSWN